MSSECSRYVVGPQEAVFACFANCNLLILFRYYEIVVGVSSECSRYVVGPQEAMFACFANCNLLIMCYF